MSNVHKVAPTKDIYVAGCFHFNIGMHHARPVFPPAHRHLLSCAFTWQCGRQKHVRKRAGRSLVVTVDSGKQALLYRRCGVYACHTSRLLSGLCRRRAAHRAAAVGDPVIAINTLQKVRESVKRQMPEEEIEEEEAATIDERKIESMHESANHVPKIGAAEGVMPEATSQGMISRRQRSTSKTKAVVKP